MALAQCFLCGAGVDLSCSGPCAVASILSQVNHQLESRMREIRLSGSEGGGAKPIVSPYPYSMKGLSRKNFSLAGRWLKLFFSAASHSTLPKQFKRRYHSGLASHSP
jgi:hypothetical protein